MTEPGPATERISVTAARWALGGATAVLVGLASGATALLVVTSTTGAAVPLDDPSSLPYAEGPGEAGTSGVLLVPGDATASTSSPDGRRAVGRPARDPRSPTRASSAAARTTGNAERTGPSAVAQVDAPGRAGADQPAPAPDTTTDRPAPTVTGKPTAGPTTKPTAGPAKKPTAGPTKKPTAKPSDPAGGPDHGEPKKDEPNTSSAPGPGTATPSADKERDEDDGKTKEKDKGDKDDKKDKHDKADDDRRDDQRRSSDR